MAHNQPLVKIYKHPAPNLLIAYINPAAMDMIGVYEIVFCDRDLTIKEPALHTRQTFTINKKGKSFTFGAKSKDPEELVGEYELEKICDGEFLLNIL